MGWGRGGGCSKKKYSHCILTLQHVWQVGQNVYKFSSAVMMMIKPQFNVMKCRANIILNIFRDSVRACVRACARAPLHALRIVSMERLLRFTNTFIIIISAC